MYFTVMGRGPVVIINYVKYLATYDIVAVALLWRWMSYIHVTKNIVFVFCNCKVYSKFHADCVIELTPQNPFTDDIAVFVPAHGTYRHIYSSKQHSRFCKIC